MLAMQHVAGHAWCTALRSEPTPGVGIPSAGGCDEML
eukprot:gene15752-12500_t